MNTRELRSTAATLVAEGKGILALDESNGTCGKRFEKVGVANTESNRRAYREMLLSTPRLGEFISGAILYDETIRQLTSRAFPFPDLMKKAGIIPGIKVDSGAKDLAGHPGEKVTEGLDGLRERFVEYRRRGARFAKWRAVITIGDGLPTPGCMRANAHALARYAALSQEAGLVPIVEPEVLMDGDHTIERCEEVTAATLFAVFRELREQRVMLEGMILKASMVLSGKTCPEQAGVEEVAERTLRCLRRSVPPAVAGIAFLSGGQDAERATVHLNAMNTANARPPWPLTFSYARALQDAALRAWKGETANVPEAQHLLRLRARCNAAAARGTYGESLQPARVA